MRIIAGAYGGRVISTPNGHKTHPMSEKMRGAIFNSLGDISGLTVLDAFAGSGAVGLEAISRGAKSVVSIDSDVKAYKTIISNSQELGLKKPDFNAVHAPIGPWCESNQNRLYDVVIADPPYDNVKPELLEKISGHTISGGIFVVSLPPEESWNPSASFELLSVKNYGDSKLLFFRRTN